MCGLRRSEVLGLGWDAVDLERGEITVRAGRVLLGNGRTTVDDPKSSASRRTVPVEQIQPGTVAMLRSLKAHQAAQRLALGGWPSHGLVVANDEGLPVRPEAYSDRFRMLSREGDLPTVRLHAVRHTLALIMHRAGVAPADAAALLGHTLAVHLATYIPAPNGGSALLRLPSVVLSQGLCEMRVRRSVYTLSRPALQTASDKALYGRADRI